MRCFVGDTVFETVSPRNIWVSVARSHGLPVTVYDFRSPGGQAYVKLSAELRRRERRSERGAAAARSPAA